MKLCPADLTALPVARSGKSPEILTDAQPGEWIDRFREDGCASVAVITPTIAMAQGVYDRLNRRDILLIKDENQAGEGPVKVMPVTLAKGLEFDGVIVVWPDTVLTGESRRWLYTACSRALHRLVVIVPPTLREALLAEEGR